MERDCTENLSERCRRLEALLAFERRRSEDIEGSKCWRLAVLFRRALVALRNLRGRLAPARREALSAAMHLPEGRRRAEECADASGMPVVSILTPLFNTPRDFLVEMIDSVRGQTFPRWELCLADASDEGHAYVGELARECAKGDARIKYTRLAANGGISANTNAALALATGSLVAILDHDDVLHPSALFAVAAASARGADFVYTDEARFDSGSRRIVESARKSDFDPDLLRGMNYICHFAAFSRKLLDEVGGFDPRFDGAQDHDLFLRLTERSGRIVHLPEVLYYWRSHPGSTAQIKDSKPQAGSAGAAAVKASLERQGLKGEVEVLSPSLPTWYRVRYAIAGSPLVSVIIPTRDHFRDLRRCLDSLFAKTTYRSYEIVVVDNGSTEKELLDYLKGLAERPGVKVLKYDAPFNYSAINNFAAAESSGEHLLFLNNDTEVISPEWMEEMLMFAQRPDVGAVGAKLVYPDGTIQHGGVALGVGGVADHVFKGVRRSSPGYGGRLSVPAEYSAVTAACMMMRRAVFDEVGGFDPALAVAFNDVDLCMKIRKAGYHIVFTPFAELLHYESKSRGSDETGERRVRATRERWLFQERWIFELDAGDPYYNPAFGLKRPTFKEPASCRVGEGGRP